MNAASKKRIGWVALAVFNCLFVMPWLARVVGTPYDFAAFYSAAQVYRHNPNHLLYDIQLQFQTEKTLFALDDAAAARHFLAFYHLPYELVLWLPFAALPYEPAFWIWRGMNLGLLLLTSWLFARALVPRRDVKTVFIISLAFFPVPFCLLMGQDSLVILTLFAACLYWLKEDQPVLAGAALGLGLFKLQFVLPIVGILVLRRLWRMAAGFILSSTVVVAISTAMVGFGGMKALVAVWRKGESGAILAIDPHRMPNIRGLLTFMPGLTPRSPAIAIIAVILSTVLLFLAVHQIKKFGTPKSMIAISTCFVMLVSFHSNLYDFALLTLPVLLLLEVDTRSRPVQWRVSPLLFLLFFTPLYVVVLAFSTVGPLAILPLWLWYGISYGVGRRQIVSLESTPSITDVIEDQSEVKNCVC